MGVQILSNDVTVISSINGTAKGIISNVMGATGWVAPTTTTTTAAPVVIPNPTPNWPDVFGANQLTDTSARVIGITTSITLTVYWSGSNVTVNDFFITTNTVNSFPGSNLINVTASPVTFSVNPSDYVIFRLVNNNTGSSKSLTANVTNASNSGTLLDTFVLSSNR